MALGLKLSRYDESGVELIVGTTYTFGGRSWQCMSQTGTTAVLQCVDGGFGTGEWAGYIANGRKYLNGSYAYSNIASFYTTTSTWWSSYGSLCADNAGLYLVNLDRVGPYNGPETESQLKWRSAISQAATSVTKPAWTGYGFLASEYNGVAYSVLYGGGQNSLYSSSQGSTGLVAPAFDIDTSKIKLNGTTITPK